MIKTNNAKQSEYLDIIEHRAKSLGSLINEFYELSVIDDNDYHIEIEKIDIAAVLTNSLMGNHSLFEEKLIKPNISIPQKAVYVLGNSGACERIFGNLITNAIKFTSGDISVSLIESESICTIKIGNPTTLLIEEDALHLFDRFYTADKSRGGNDTGLGLYIVKTLVEKLGGEILSTFSNGVFEKVESKAISFVK